MNDILRPELLWIEGRCYRVHDPATEITAFQEYDLYENDTPLNEVDEDDDDTAYEIVMIDSNRYTTNIHVPRHYIGSIIGKKGATISRIGRDTKTVIKIPRHGENSDISIFGPSITNVKAAIRRINIIVMAARMKQKPTHFISIPMNAANIVEGFERFKVRVLQDCPNVDESLFIRSTKLHITLGVMCLMHNEERQLASKLLLEAKDKCILPIVKEFLPLKIRLKGLSYMNDDPKAVDVLYGCVEEVDAPSGILQQLVDSIFNHFKNAGLMHSSQNHEIDNVKMHVTLLNSKYRQRQQNSDLNDNKHKRETFDGSDVLLKFSNYDFGVTELRDVHLSQRNTSGPDGYYLSTVIISVN
ncbi:activating signal cointegrator 1 complex subunit 1 [Danaus plexippus]|uniref:activating signal cointegrator 1 complex subunit 1 n=1 Tax=Danaus plexippus TaxID=13037 RepID=UPI002AB2D641|nr:activating signal cointegrator 1 complex subunit 1 [Danaus plexippus]